MYWVSNADSVYYSNALFLGQFSLYPGWWLACQSICFTPGAQRIYCKSRMVVGLSGCLRMERHPQTVVSLGPQVSFDLEFSLLSPSSSSSPRSLSHHHQHPRCHKKCHHTITKHWNDNVLIIISILVVIEYAITQLLNTGKIMTLKFSQCYSDSDEEDLRAEQLLLKDKLVLCI